MYNGGEFNKIAKSMYIIHEKGGIHVRAQKWGGVNDQPRKWGEWRLVR